MTLPIEVGSKEWLESRRKLVTATDVPILLEVSPWCTPLQLYWRKKNGEEIVKTAAMQRGIDLEPEARALFTQHTGEDVYPLFKVSEKYEWLAASFDGINDHCFVEIKCPGAADHLIACEGLVPEKYIPQVQAQMMVSGFDFGWYFSYSPSSSTPCVLLKVYADWAMQDRIRILSKHFYDCLQSGTPPEPCDRDMIQRSDRSWLMLEEEYVDILHQETALALRKEEVKTKLIELCDGKPTKGYRLRMTPVKRIGNVQYDKIPELKNVDLEFYRKPGSIYWKALEI